MSYADSRTPRLANHVHTGDRCANVWAFAHIVEGELHETFDPDYVDALVPGMTVALRDGQADAQVASPHGGYLIVRDGRFIDWTTEPAADLECLGPHGGLASVEQIANATYSVGRDDIAQAVVMLQATPPDGYTAATVEELAAFCLTPRFRAQATGRPHNCQVCDTLSNAAALPAGPDAPDQAASANDSPV